MDIINKIIKYLRRKQVPTINECIVDAFQTHFGTSINDVDLREIEYTVIEGDIEYNLIESYRYRGKTFLYVISTLTQKVLIW